MSMGQDSETARDVSMEAVEQLYEWLKRPYSELAFADFTPAKMRNFFYKSIRNRCINIVKKENRRSKMVREVIEKIKNSIGIGLDEPIDVFDTPDSPEGPENLIKCFGPFMIDLNRVSLEDLKKEVFYFIEETFGRAKWKGKKFAVDLFFERFQQGLSIKEFKKMHPGENLPSLNTEAHRTMKNYFKWARKSGCSKLFENNALWAKDGNA